MTVSVHVDVLYSQKLTLLGTEAMQESDKLPAGDFDAATDIIKQGEVLVSVTFITLQFTK